MNIKMLKSERGSVDGIIVQNFKEGEMYDLPSSLAEVFVKDMGVAEYTTDEPIQVEQKAMGAAPENKMAETEEVENKDQEEYVYRPRGRR
jgi:hypothetical protein